MGDLKTEKAMGLKPIAFSVGNIMSRPEVTNTKSVDKWKNKK